MMILNQVHLKFVIVRHEIQFTFTLTQGKFDCPLEEYLIINDSKVQSVIMKRDICNYQVFFLQYPLIAFSNRAHIFTIAIDQN